MPRRGVDKPIRRVGIVAKPGRDDIPALVTQLLSWLDARGIKTECDLVASEYLGRAGGFDRDQMPDGIDLLIVLGGDGTLLSAARGVGRRETPILAVNLGGLGFMMTTGPDELLPQLERVVAGDYATSCRATLFTEIIRGGKSLGRHNALNDVVINKAAVARLLLLDAYVDGEFVSSYRADGMIISTPTGSTAYSLSAGGPVIYPSVLAICLTPICPHTLTNRPLVLPDRATIEVVVQGGDRDSYLTIDGQVGLELQLHDRIRTQLADHCIHIIEPNRVRFFEVLRSKMKWG
jgi:NAD+ kinase